jgi:hypothetical protein
MLAGSSARQSLGSDARGVSIRLYGRSLTLTPEMNRRCFFSSAGYLSCTSSAGGTVMCPSRTAILVYLVCQGTITRLAHPSPSPPGWSRCGGARTEAWAYPRVLPGSRGFKLHLGEESASAVDGETPTSRGGVWRYRATVIGIFTVSIPQEREIRRYNVRSIS